MMLAVFWDFDNPFGPQYLIPVGSLDKFKLNEQFWTLVFIMDQQQKPPQQDDKSNSQKHVQSPLQNLNYHRQQQIHRRHIQKIGGLHMLTADLASHFHDSEQFSPLQPQTQIQQSPSPAVRARQTQPKQPQHPINQVTQPTSPQRNAVQLEIPPPDQLEPHKSELSQDAEKAEAAAKDAKETAEDAAVLKRYRICQLVGTGNYARVYKGIFPANNKEIAIKAINLSRTTENYRHKFLPRELAILKRISHVNICKIHEIVQVTDHIFIIMQYCSRGTIADLLQRNQGPVSENIGRFLFAPTLEALVYLHSIDIAHRDVKIENILLDKDFVPKLTDFSYSCFLSDHLNAHSPIERSIKLKTTNSDKQSSQPNQRVLKRLSSLSMRLNETFCGTLPYLSPEMIRQFPYDSRKTDIWSLGICLYVMLNDRLPFPFNDIKLMVKKQLTRDFKFRSEMSEPCKDLINKLLEPDFLRRLGACDANRHSWLNGPRERPDRQLSRDEKK